MISGIFFILTRIAQLIFIIPPLGILSAVVHGYLNGNEVTPAFALTLFIVVVLATIWILATMLLYGIAKHNGYLVAFVDLCLFGALIAGVVEANGMAAQSCGNVNVNSNVYKQSGIWVYNFGSLCSMIKAAYAFAIIELILFFFSMLFALWVHHTHRNDRDENEPGYRRTTEKHYSRYNNRRDRDRSDVSRSNSRYDDRRSRGGSRGGSRSRSRQGPRRDYV